MSGMVGGEQGARRRGTPVLALAAALLAGLLIAGSAQAQCTPPRVTVVTDKTVEVFRVGDFDPSDAHVHPYVFSLALCSDGRPMKLRFEVSSDREGLLASGITDIFPSPDGTVPLTNRDLTEVGLYELRDYWVVPESQDLEDRIVETGRLPEGRYTFKIVVRDADDAQDLAQGEDYLDVRNPLDLELLRPGAAFGDDLPAVITPHPQFQFMSQAKCWQLKLAMAEPGDASGEDVMEHVPVYTAMLALSPGGCAGDPAETVSSAGGLVSWNYPSAGEDLARGRTYCWQVTAVVQTSGGPEEVASEVYCFRRWNPEDQGAEMVAAALEQILEQLRQTLGPDLEGLTPTGAAWLDGEAVDASVVQEILDGIAAGRIRIVETKIE